MTRYTCFQPVAGLTAALFAFTLGYTGFAQNLSGLPPAGPGHEFTESSLVGSWVTLHKEFLNFQATGKVYFDKEKGEKRQGDWSVSNGTIWVTWSGAAGPTLMPMLVTAFNEGAIRVEGQGGKVLAVMVRRSAGETSRHSVPMAVKPLAMPLPHLDDHGGPIADHPSNHAMYWHSDWDSVHSDPQFKRGNIDGWLSDFMASNYFDKSNQYGTNSGSFAGSAGNFSLFPDPGGTTDSGLIAAWAFGMIQTPFTGVPYPCSSNDVYTVMLPKDTTIDNGFNKTCSSFGAYHLFGPVVVPPTAFGIGPCGIFDTGGLRFPAYPVIPVQCATKPPGPNEFYNDFDALTVLISHETLEAMTDPIDSFAASVPFIGGILNAFLDILDVGPGWYDDNAADLFTNSEAADICESPRNEEVWLNNSLVAAYWSNADNDCAAGPGVVRNFSLNQTGVPPGIPVRVAFDSRTPNVNAGGGFTIQVATNTSHSYSYPSPVAGPTGVRYLTGQPPATVAVTDTFSVTAPYSTQFFLTVGANPPAAGIGNLSLTPSDWHAPGPFTLQADQDVSAGGGIRYDFTSWSGDVSGNTHNLAINLESPTTATANYALQDLVTFNETGIPAGPPWHVMVDGATHAGPFPDFVNNGATVHYSYDVVVPGAPGTCYVLGSITPPSPLTVTAPATVIGAYSTQTTPQAILNYQLAGVQPAAGNQSYVTYSADVVNCGRALTSVTATLTSLDPFTVRVVPGQGTLNFAPVPANSEVTSSNTFTILTNASIPFDFSKLSWAFSPAPAPPIANPGPNQSVAVGSTVTLDGSGSANPSGIGSLTYNWIFVSRPPGSSPALRFSTTPSAQFVANAPGTYVIMLTVSNGMASNSSTVTVTAF